MGRWKVRVFFSLRISSLYCKRAKIRLSFFLAHWKNVEKLQPRWFWNLKIFLLSDSMVIMWGRLRRRWIDTAYGALCQRITRGLELFVGINLAMRGVDWKRSTAKHTNVLGALSVRAAFTAAYFTAAYRLIAFTAAYRLIAFTASVAKCAQCQNDLNHRGYYDAGVLLHTRCHTMHNLLPTLAF